jgi:hypothetical protein
MRLTVGGVGLRNGRLWPTSEFNRGSEILLDGSTIEKRRAKMGGANVWSTR